MAVGNGGRRNWSGRGGSSRKAWRRRDGIGNDWSAEAKAHPVKVEIARLLRGQTTMPLKWIAQELRTGSWSYLNELFRKGRK